ncbi:hypothetical protein EST38_g11446 [Candolleomyces aberdarensis]|uniref:Uncharacterized protein n=1 Tax=Candolleomyces aberdarensis TaxID=2316362 RepID=A0A4Q2D4V4_9AGAR|nr:hypothetical protein EST38_g11446 [Candolleomyces aberdarensis]
MATSGMIPGTTMSGHKRPRVDTTATPFEAGSSGQRSPIAELTAVSIPLIGNLSTPASLQSNPGQYFDLSQVINALISRDKMHADIHKFNRASINRVSAALEEQKDLQNHLEAQRKALEDRITQLEEQIAAGAATGLESGPQPRQKRNVALENAVRDMMRDLLDAKEERVQVPDEKMPGKFKTKVMLRLPHPLPDGAEKRKDPGGGVLFNPNWTVPSPLKDKVNNIRILLTSYKQGSVECTEKKLKTQAEQYFGSLITNYKAQNYPEQQKKQEAHKNASKRAQRKQAKYRNRTKVLSSFAERHSINTSLLAKVVVYEAMSSDDEGPGNVSQDTWNQRANIKRENDRAFETLPLAFRATWQVSRLYYALDKLAAANHNVPRFHGFRQNMQTEAPKKALPRSMMDHKWIAHPENEHVRTVEDPEGLDAGDLHIDDDELWPQDLEYLRELEEAYDADEE